MNISTKGRYAVRIMVRLAMARDTLPQRKQDIAEAEGLSANYIEQIMLRLRAAGLVRSHRGANGGFTLERSAAGISVADILDVMEGPLHISPCLDAPRQCNRTAECVTRPIWQEAGSRLYEYFDSIKLDELARKALEIEAHNTVSFSI